MIIKDILIYNFEQAVHLSRILHPITTNLSTTIKSIEPTVVS